MGNGTATVEARSQMFMYELSKSSGCRYEPSVDAPSTLDGCCIGCKWYLYLSLNN